MTRVGLLLPTRETAIRHDGDARKLVDLARRAEASGFDSVWAGDSMLARPRVEPLTLLAGVATATTSITVGTAALTGSLRHPLLAAHVIATVDRLSEGRLVLGSGAGFPYPASEAEFAAAGVPFAERFGRMLETIRIWRLVWEGSGASGFSGRYWTFSDLSGLPLPVQSGGPPLWLAGGGPTALRLAGALFDGWLPYPPEPGQYTQGWSTVRTAAIGAQRDASALTGGLYITVLPCKDEKDARARLDEYTRAYYGAPIESVEKLQAFVGGPMEQCLARLQEYVRAGAEHIVLRIGSLQTDRYFDAVARLAEDVAACG